MTQEEKFNPQDTQLGGVGLGFEKAEARKKTQYANRSLLLIAERKK
jgi:hypothetical protein